MQKSNQIVAAGAVLWRNKPTERPTNSQKTTIEVAIVHRPRYNDWSWPKGKVKAGETVAAAAVREVAEETGCEITLGLPLPSAQYRVGQSQKRVFYWLARPAHSAHLKGRAEWKRASKHEIDRVRWVTLEQAKRLLTREIDRKLAQKAARLLQDPDCFSPSCVVMVRHAKAMKRHRWAEQGTVGDGLGSAAFSDEQRPLTGSGLEQAQRLAGTLSAFGVGQVFSSPSLRCIQTMQAFTTAASVELKQVKAFSEEAFQEHRERTLAVWAAILDTYFREEFCKNAAENKQLSRQPIAVCSHRPVLPTLIQELLKSPENQTTEQNQRTNPLEAGECIIAHFRPTGALLSTQFLKS